MMPTRLILIRHAKSSWSDFSLSDHDRPLNKRGRAAATALGRWLRDNGYRPDIALVSTALRTRETFDRLESGATLQLEQQLYQANSETILGTLQKAKSSCAMLIGHNPGIGDFASRIVTSPPEHNRFRDYPTGATLVADLPVEDWDSVRFGSATPVDFITPRELQT